MQELEQLKVQDLNLNIKMTEKNYNPQQKQKKAMKKSNLVENMKKNPEKAVEKKSEETIKENKVEKKEVKKVKKDFAVVNSYSLPISTKKASAICKFIKGKTIEQAREFLEKISKGKMPLPMKGEIPHKKGIMSGGFPKKATEHFLVLLKSLSGNCVANEIDNPVISEAISNLASRPYARFGRWRKKRTHVKITAINKKEKEKKNGRKKSS